MPGYAAGYVRYKRGISRIYDLLRGLEIAALNITVTWSYITYLI